MSSCLSIIYIWGLLTCFHLNKESLIVTIKYVCSFFLFFKLCNSGLQIIHLHSNHLRLWAVLVFEVFYGGIFQKINFNSWSFFRCFFWSVNFAGWAFLSQHIRILLLLAIFPDLETAQFWSVNYICQVYKLKLLFWTCPKFWTIFILIGSYL